MTTFVTPFAYFTVLRTLPEMILVYILRVLFGLTVFKIVDWGGVFAATLLCEEEAPLEKVLTRSMKNSSVLLALFITLWVIAMGWL